MQILFSRCCGIDVHKDSVTACVLIYAEGQEPEVRKKEFPTHFKSLGNLRFWLMAQKVTHVAMESTGVYWKPVWQALEGHFELILANPFQIKTVPGRKTDARDSQWIAELLAHGLIRPRFVPPRATRDLRDLTRYRVKLVQERNRIHNRIHKSPRRRLHQTRHGGQRYFGRHRTSLHPGHHRRPEASRLAGRQSQRKVTRQACGIASGSARTDYRSSSADAARTAGGPGVRRTKDPGLFT
jgi:transposase